MHFSIEHGDHEGLSLCLMFLFVYCRITLIILDFNWWLSTSHLNEARGKCSIIEITFPKQSTNIFQLGKISWSKPTRKKQQNQLYHKHPNQKLNIAMWKIHPLSIDVSPLKKPWWLFPAITMLVFSERRFFFSHSEKTGGRVHPARGRLEVAKRCHQGDLSRQKWPGGDKMHSEYIAPSQKRFQGLKRGADFSVGNMTQLWDSICILYIYSNVYHRITWKSYK